MTAVVYKSYIYIYITVATFCPQRTKQKKTREDEISRCVRHTIPDECLQVWKNMESNWDLDNSYSRQLVPRTTRTQDNSYPRQHVPKTTRTQENSYPGQLVPKTTRTQDNTYPRQLVPRITRTQDNSYPRQLVPTTTRTHVVWYDMIWFDMICHDMIWYDTIPYDIISCHIAIRYHISHHIIPMCDNTYLRRKIVITFLSKSPKSWNFGCVY